MEIGDALRIMRALADGVNPETGEVAHRRRGVSVPARGPSIFTAAVRALEYVAERERSRNAGGERGQVLVPRRGRTGLRRAAPEH